ncbi:hypothetical protein KIL84_006405, partial [Mauremys mutica]
AGSGPLPSAPALPAGRGQHPASLHPSRSPGPFAGWAARAGQGPDGPWGAPAVGAPSRPDPASAALTAAARSAPGPPPCRAPHLVPGPALQPAGRGGCPLDTAQSRARARARPPAPQARPIASTGQTEIRGGTRVRLNNTHNVDDSGRE